MSTGERVGTGEDFSGHVGEENRCDEEVFSRYGIKERNAEGQMLVDSDTSEGCGT